MIITIIQLIILLYNSNYKGGRQGGAERPRLRQGADAAKHSVLCWVISCRGRNAYPRLLVAPPLPPELPYSTLIANFVNKKIYIYIYIYIPPEPAKTAPNLFQRGVDYGKYDPSPASHSAPLCPIC